MEDLYLQGVHDGIRYGMEICIIIMFAYLIWKNNRKGGRGE